MLQANRKPSRQCCEGCPFHACGPRGGFVFGLDRALAGVALFFSRHNNNNGHSSDTRVSVARRASFQRECPQQRTCVCFFGVRFDRRELALD